MTECDGCLALPTPSTQHVAEADWRCVYEPAEDTHVLLDAVQLRLSWLRRRRPSLVLEVGSGSGVVAAGVAAALPHCCVITTDISAPACTCTMAVAAGTAGVNGRVLSVRCDLAAAVREGQVDLLLFNAPYVPTSREELSDAADAAARGLEEAGLAAAWAGGVRGREVIDRLLGQLNVVLSEYGVVFIVAVHENDIEDLCRQLDRLGFSASVLLRRRAGCERLYVVQAMRMHDVHQGS